MTRRLPRVPGTRRNVLMILTSIPDDLDAATKNRRAVRNACAIEGKCPDCGAVGTLRPDGKTPGLWRYRFEHEHWCKATA